MNYLDLYRYTKEELIDIILSNREDWEKITKETKLNKNQKELVREMNSISKEIDKCAIQINCMPAYFNEDYKKREAYIKEMDILRIQHAKIQKLLGIKEK